MTTFAAGGAGRWLLLGSALLQLAAPPLIGFDTDAADPPIVPPGPFFAVWGVVVLGCLVVAVRGLPRGRAHADPYRRIQVPLSLVQIGFAGWLRAAGSPVDWLTVPIFAGMLAGLVVCLRRVLAADGGDRVSGALLGGVLGVYAGWATAAVWINTVTLLPGRALTGTAGLLVQCAAVLAATGAAAAGAWAFRGLASYTLTAGWALAGVTVSAAMAALPQLAVTAVAGILVVGIVALLRRPA